MLLDAIDDMTGATTSFANLPAGTRAIALPDNSYSKSSAFLQVFGRPQSASVCECERIQSSSLAQSLHLINSDDIKSKLATANGRAARLAAADIPTEKKSHRVVPGRIRNAVRERMNCEQRRVISASQSSTRTGKQIDPSEAARQKLSGT